MPLVKGIVDPVTLWAYWFGVLIKVITNSDGSCTKRTNVDFIWLTYEATGTDIGVTNKCLCEEIGNPSGV